MAGAVNTKASPEFLSFAVRDRIISRVKKQPGMRSQKTFWWWLPLWEDMRSIPAWSVFPSAFDFFPGQARDGHCCD
jgi:hypothetical protein